jgi:CheY-like chemotaxis protein
MGKILVIDDDKSICYLLHAFLTKMGYEVEVAHDGEKGIERFDKSAGFDLVITDIRMPKMSGRDVARHIRASDRPGTPILAITGFSEMNMGKECFDCLLTKPFNLDTLEVMVTTWIEK